MQDGDGARSCANQYTAHGQGCAGKLGVQAIETARGLEVCSQQSHWPMAHELARIARRTRPTTLRRANGRTAVAGSRLGAASNASRERQRRRQSYRQATRTHGRYSRRRRCALPRGHVCQAAASRQTFCLSSSRGAPAVRQAAAAARGQCISNLQQGDDDDVCVRVRAPVSRR